MAHNLLSRNLPVSWERSVMEGSWRTTPFLLLVVLNLTAGEALLQSCISFRKALATNPFLIVALRFVALLLLPAGFIMWRIYEQTRTESLAMAGEAKLSPLLKVSYDAFRLYVLFLGAVIMGLGFANFTAV